MPTVDSGPFPQHEEIAGVALSRSVRFSVGLPAQRNDARQASEGDDRRNSFAGSPSMRGLGLHCEMVVTVSGMPDAATGYLLNITRIDRAVRERVVPIFNQALGAGAAITPARLLRDALAAVVASLGACVRSMRWNLTPYYSLAMSAHATDRILLRQSFEFAAAHRLHVEAMSAQANREVFGKCNNPSGHGHNYRIEAAVEIAINERGESSFTLQSLERIVDQVIIQRFDHKHLNLDTLEFKNINPSVENIARISHGLLEQPLHQAGARLAQVVVWETEKTCCAYPA